MGNTQVMSDNRTEPFQAQATRSFGDYLQGAWYAIDPNDQQLMSLLGAGYFDTEGNDNLTDQQFHYEAGQVVPAQNPGTHDNMATQEHITPEEGYTPNYDQVDVPEKMTGAQRATTADETQENEATSGTVGTESQRDSNDGQRARTSARKSSGSRNS